jgi:hypothetical protein
MQPSAKSKMVISCKLDYIVIITVHYYFYCRLVLVDIICPNFRTHKLRAGLPTQTEKNPLKTPDFSQKIP